METLTKATEEMEARLEWVRRGTDADKVKSCLVNIFQGV